MSPSNRSLILASASPQRARLLEQLGMRFTAIAADIDETARAGETPQALVERLARTKAEALSAAYPEARIIGSDTIVACDEAIFGKPADKPDAERMLVALSGRTHRVFSGVALFAGGMTQTRVQVSKVTLAALGGCTIAAYWATGEPVDKAGGYAIQGRGGQFVSHLSGSYSAVMGLPLYETSALLAASGLNPLEAA